MSSEMGDVMGVREGPFAFPRRGRRKAILDATVRIMELEDAVTTILDLASGWSRPMSDEKRLEFIVQIGNDALSGHRSWPESKERGRV